MSTTSRAEASWTLTACRCLWEHPYVPADRLPQGLCPYKLPTVGKEHGGYVYVDVFAGGTLLDIDGVQVSTVGLCIGPCGGPQGGAVSSERGAPVRYL